MSFPYICPYDMCVCVPCCVCVFRDIVFRVIIMMGCIICVTFRVLLVCVLRVVLVAYVSRCP